MTVVAQGLPDPRTLLAVEDAQAKRALQNARTEIAPIVSAETPRQSGRLAAAIAPRVGRTATGYSMRVGAPRGKAHGNVTVRQVLLWVSRGTGKYREGPGPKHRIHAKHPFRRMILPGGHARWSVRGQRPDPFMARIEARATPRVDAALEAGAEDCARELERVVARP